MSCCINPCAAKEHHCPERTEWDFFSPNTSQSNLELCWTCTASKSRKPVGTGDRLDPASTLLLILSAVSVPPSVPSYFSLSLCLLSTSSISLNLGLPLRSPRLPPSALPHSTIHSKTYFHFFLVLKQRKVRERMVTWMTCNQSCDSVCFFSPSIISSPLFPISQLSVTQHCLLFFSDNQLTSPFSPVNP